VDWFKHPSYVPLRDRLISRFQSQPYILRSTKPLIFLCGANKSLPRENLANYFRKKHPDKFIFYADDVWTLISKHSDLNALQMEDQLAQLSDAVIILAESPGTFAELGAFSLNAKLRKKLLPIIDKKHQDEHSFINTGPVRWVDKDSKFKPTIYVDFSIILTAVHKIEERLGHLPRRQSGEIFNIDDRPKHLLFLLFDLLSIISPASDEHITFYLERIIGKSPKWKTINLLGLGVALGQVSHLEVNGTRFYYRSPNSKPFDPFLHKRLFNLERERAIFLSVFFKIPKAMSVLKRIQEED
jgi:hypothetical protein